jgi:hypothetical protein
MSQPPSEIVKKLEKDKKKFSFVFYPFKRQRIGELMGERIG